MDQVPPKKPKNYSKTLDMLNTKAAANMFSPKTYVNLVGEFSKKALDNNEISQTEYMKIIRPLYGYAVVMASKKIKEYQDELNKYSIGGRVNFLDGGDTKYNAMVTGKYIELGGKEGTGMDIDKFADTYFPKDKVIKIPQMANGGRMGYSDGSKNNELRKRVEELMDDGYEFGEAVKEAMKEGYAIGGRVNYASGTMSKSEKWMREYFFDGKGGYDDRMSYKEFALGPGQSLYKKFND
jgi:hypothetical protein